MCRACGAEQELGPFYACQECFGPLEVGYDFPLVTARGIESGPKNIWRYADLLPVRPDIATMPNTEPGFTRLIKADNLARELGIKTLWVKDDSGNPTHSFKDRVVAVALAAARELGSHDACLSVHRQPGQRRRGCGRSRRHPERRLHPATTSSDPRC